MSDTSLRTHPLIVIAATTVILTCLLAIGVMTGVVPSPLTRDGVATQSPPAAAAPDASSALAELRRSQTTALQDHRAGESARPGAQQRPPVGATSGPAASGSVRADERAPRVAALCTTCGRVVSVRAVTRQGEAGLLGPVAGGAVGGLVGHQIGHGSGNTIATIVGAAGGAALGTELERRHKSTTQYVVTVRLNDGTHRTFNYASRPAFQEGDRVRVAQGRLIHES
jgi:outer membrane lipoprotein SlyB